MLEHELMSMATTGDGRAGSTVKRGDRLEEIDDDVRLGFAHDLVQLPDDAPDILGRFREPPRSVALLLDGLLSLYLNSKVGNRRTGVFMADSKYSGTCGVRSRPA